MADNSSKIPAGAHPSNGGYLLPGWHGQKVGHPKGQKNRSTIARRWLDLEQSFKNPLTGIKETLTQADIITLTLIKEARKGSVSAYKELMDSGFGKLQDNLNITGDVDLSKHIKIGIDFDEPENSEVAQQSETEKSPE